MPLYAHEQRIYGMKHFADGVDNEGQVIQSGVRTLTDAGTLLTTDDDVSMVEWDATALTADRTATLPPVKDNTGRVIEFVKMSARGTYQAIIDGYGSETINGLATYELWDQYTWVRLKALSSGWVRIGGSGYQGLAQTQLSSAVTASVTNISAAGVVPVGARNLWVLITCSDELAGSAIAARKTGVGQSHVRVAAQISSVAVYGDGPVPLDTSRTFDQWNSTTLRTAAVYAIGYSYE